MKRFLPTPGDTVECRCRIEGDVLQVLDPLNDFAPCKDPYFAAYDKFEDGTCKWVLSDQPLPPSDEDETRLCADFDATQFCAQLLRQIHGEDALVEIGRALQHEHVEQDGAFCFAKRPGEPIPWQE